MNEVSRSSFIPKQTRTPVSAQAHRRGRFNALAFVSIVLLVGSLALAIGTFVYKDYFISKQLVAEKEALAEERGKFNEADIARVRELDRRMVAANVLLNSHLAPTKLLDTLEIITKKDVQFTSFSFEKLPSNDVFLSLTGVTDNFKTVALQAQAFAEDPLLRESLFAGVSTFDEEVEEGVVPETLVDFSVSGNISAVHLMFDGFDTYTENSEELLVGSEEGEAPEDEAVTQDIEGGEEGNNTSL